MEQATTEVKTILSFLLHNTTRSLTPREFGEFLRVLSSDERTQLATQALSLMETTDEHETVRV